MIKDIIEHINDQLAETDYFQKQFELCELIKRSDGQVSPKQYCSKGEWKEVSNFDSYHGVSYWRKNGDVSVATLDPASTLIPCDVYNKFSIPLKLIAVIPRHRLKYDDAYSDDRTVQSLIEKLYTDTSTLGLAIQAQLVEIFVDSYSTDNQKIITQEYSQINPVDINYNFIYLSIDLRVDVTINQSCIETECEYGI